MANAIPRRLREHGRVVGAEPRGLVSAGCAFRLTLDRRAFEQSLGRRRARQAADFERFKELCVRARSEAENIEIGEILARSGWRWRDPRTR